MTKLFSVKPAALFCILPMGISSLAASASSVTLTSQDQTDLAVTLYTDNLGLIQDTRTLSTLSPNQNVIIRDISKQMQTETLQIRGAGKIKEQTLNSSILNYQSLLEHHIGKQVTLVKELQSGDEISKDVQLLSINGNRALVQNTDKIESIPLNSHWRFIFSEKPESLLLKPSLTFKSSGTTSEGNAQLSYLTQGLSWQMDYVMTMDKSGDNAVLDGLASLNNSTGTSLENARIKLLAGDVNRVAPSGRYAPKAVMMAAADAELAGNPAPESLNDYKLYTLAEPVTLLNQQRTQVPLIHADSVEVDSLQRFQFYISPHVDSQTHKVKPESYIRFINNKNHGIGQPLPSGSVRFFAPDSEGELHYVGGSHIGQTAVGEKVELAMGRSVDVTVTQKQTDYQTAFDGTVVAYELRIKNAAKQDKEIEVSSLFSTPWKLISSTYQPVEQSAGSAKWKVSVQGSSETVLTMRVRLKTKNN